MRFCYFLASVVCLRYEFGQSARCFDLTFSADQLGRGALKVKSRCLVHSRFLL